jgi:hypothetical protein
VGAVLGGDVGAEVGGDVGFEVVANEGPRVGLGVGVSEGRVDGVVDGVLVPGVIEGLEVSLIYAYPPLARASLNESVTVGAQYAVSALVSATVSPFFTDTP